MQVVDFTERHRQWAEELLASYMGSSAVALRGRLYDPLAHPGLVAFDEGSAAGLLTYIPGGQWWEILSLHTAEPGRGTGSVLMEAVAKKARRAGRRLLRVTTTNDNTCLSLLSECRVPSGGAAPGSGRPVTGGAEAGNPGHGLHRDTDP